MNIEQLIQQLRAAGNDALANSAERFSMGTPVDPAPTPEELPALNTITLVGGVAKASVTPVTPAS